MADYNEDIIDLTECSYASANHCLMKDILINLDTDDSFSDASNKIPRTGRKRRNTRARIIIGEEVPVLDLCTPEKKPHKTATKRGKACDTLSIAEPVDEPKQKKAKVESRCCPICFEEFCGQPLATTKCGHVFCMDCLKQALSKYSRCPACRTVLRGSSKSKYHAIYL